MNYEKKFRESYEELNLEQRSAVDQIDDPLRVIAGPGTGKTQLLGIRVANMIYNGVDPENILALTFTENGAREMFERVSRFTGAKIADKVEIYTYHGFGQRILELGHDFVNARRRPADEINKYEIIKEIREKMSIDNFLLNEFSSKSSSILSAISDVKNEGISPNELREMSKQNLDVIAKINEVLAGIDELPNGRSNEGKAKASEFYSNLAQEIFAKNPKRINKNNPTFTEMIETNFREKFAEWETQPENKNGLRPIKPLSDWFKHFFEKNAKGKYVAKDEFASKKAISLADFYEKYEEKMHQKELMDFSDMIIEAIDLIQKNPDFKASLQERFQYILLDEYQDTNGLQSRLVELLTDRDDGISPNVMAVGDDDQAIMAFQGAEVSNIENFTKFYEDRGHKVTKITLTENYRSPQEILDFGSEIASQIESRVVANKVLNSGRKYESPAEIIRENYENQPAEFFAITQQIKTLIDNGTSPNEIAVLAPKHKILEGIAKFLNDAKIPIRYEKSENILEGDRMIEFLNMLKLAVAISADNPNQNAFWPRVLAADFWQISAIKIFELSQNFQRESRKEESLSFTEIIRMDEDEKVRKIGDFFAILSTKIDVEPFEKITDFITGTLKVKDAIFSPMREFIAKKSMRDLAEFAAQLTIIRDRFLDFANDKNGKINSSDFLDFIDLIRENELKITNTNPFETNENSVEIMTAFSAKGLEWENVFLLDVNNKTWGTQSGNNQGISLPKNFAKIKDPDALNTRRRLFFVAATRAKKRLILANYLYDFAGNKTKPLSFLRENDEQKIVEILPENLREIHEKNVKTEDIPQILSVNWIEKFKPEELKNEQIFAKRIREFVMSASAVEKYYDLKDGGPKKFFEQYILNFPSERSGSMQFGTIMHNTFDEYNKRARKGEIWDMQQTLDFAIKEIKRENLSEDREKILRDRANRDFPNFWKSGRHKLLISDLDIRSEYSPRKMLLDGEIPMNGRIDRLEIDHENKKITIVDWKTGKIEPEDKFDYVNNKGVWGGKVKLHNYMTQLYFYRIQLKNDPDFANYSIEDARLEFIEGSDKHGNVPIVCELKYDDAEEERVREMLRKLWRKIQKCDFAEHKDFPGEDNNVSVKTIREFEDMKEEN